MNLHATLFGAPAVDRHLTDSARIQALLEAEAALAESQASIGMIPAPAAAAIRRAARSELFDVNALAASAAARGNVVIPLVEALTAAVAADDAEAARFVHWGATSQDIHDTALVLQLNAAVGEVLQLLARAADAAAALATRHAETPVAGRTWMQQATPTTFGLKAAGWCLAIDRARAALLRAMAEASVVQLGGASGTRAAFCGRGAEIATAFGARLGLGVPVLSWHTHRDGLAGLCAALGVAAGTLGKAGRDLVLLAQTEVAEAGPGLAGQSGSSSMPHKNNPVAATVAVAASIRAPGMVATVLAAMPQEHERGAAGWQAEWETVPDLVRLVGGAARAVDEALRTLVVDEVRMLANLRANDRAASEAVAMALSPHLGRARAHGIVAAACRRADETGRDLAAELLEAPELAGRLDAATVQNLLDPTGYLGEARAMVERALGSRRHHG